MDVADTTAVNIAFKLRNRGYKTQGAAVLALRRKHKDISTAEAQALINLAGSVFRSAVAFLKPQLKSLALEYQSKKGVASETIDGLELKFRTVCPECSQAMRQSAIGVALYYFAR